VSVEVRIVLTRLSDPDPDGHPQRRHVDLAPAKYDLDAGPTLGARPLTPEETPGDFADYVTPVVDDMLSLSANIVHQYAREWVTKTKNPSASTLFSADRTDPQFSDLYVRLLVDFSTQHRELLINMLASLLADSIESTAHNPAFVDQMTRRIATS
jgi:hypothetical protein